MKRIAVMSGKGGSCKTSNAANLAVALSRLGHVTALADLDITAPNTPFMMNMKKTDTKLKDYKFIKPFCYKDKNSKHDIEIVSMGFFIDSDDQPFLMRGDKKGMFVRQFIEKIYWSKNIEYMFYDMPPSSDDIFINIVRQMEGMIDGAIIAAEASRVCLLDVQRTLNLCKKINVPVLGIINNKPYVECDKCGNHVKLFTQDVKKLAKDNGMIYFGEVPFVTGADKDILIVNDYFKNIVDGFVHVLGRGD